MLKIIALLIFILSLPILAFSQTTPISGLPTATSASGSEVFPIVQSGATKKITIDNALSARTVGGAWVFSGTARIPKLGLGVAPSTPLLLFANPTPIANETLLSKNNGTFSTDVGALGAGTVINLHALDIHNTDSAAGNSFLFGHSIICEHDAVDTGACVALTNKGRADALYIVVRGKSGAATSNTPTGIGIDLNLSTGGTQNSTTFGGYGLQIWDRSTTDIGTTGPTGIFLYKQGNLNSQHRMIRIDSNRDSIAMFTDTSGATNDIAYVSDGTVKKWSVAADGKAQQTVEDSATAAVTTIYSITHNSSGTPAAGFGAAVGFKLESTTTAGQDAGLIEVLWSVPTHASRTSAMSFDLVNNAGALARAAYLAPISSGYSLALGTSPAEANIHARALDGQAASVMVEAYGAASSLILRRADDTAASPDALVTNDVIGNISARGYDGSAFTSAGRAKIEFIAGGNWTGSSHPTQIDFYTTASSSTTQTKRMSIAPAGNVDFATSFSVAGGTAVTGHLSGTASLDFTAWSGGDCQAFTITVTGAATGDTVTLGIPTSIVAGVVFTGWVSSTSTVTVRGCKITSGASSDPAADTYRADVWKH